VLRRTICFPAGGSGPADSIDIALDLDGRTTIRPPIVLVAGNSGRVALPFGTLLVDPFKAVVARTGTFDLMGRASTPVVVRSSPAWIGLTLYWQAIVGFPLGTTNLEPTTVTNL
jgi:hypothetical protein